MAAIDFPNSPTLNQEFTANGRTWIWGGTVWATKALDTTVSRYEVQDTAPSSAINGDVWFNSTNARTYVYYDSVWIESNPSLNGNAGLIQSATAPGDTGALWMDTTDSASQVAVPSGGTAGQVLTKTSGIDYATGWVDNTDNRNHIINGAFDIWQRGTSFSGPWGGMSADRWAIYHAGGTITGTVTRETFTPGAAPLPGLEGQYYLRKTVTSSSGNAYNNVEIPIEDVRTLAGQTVTFSFYAKADAARSVAVTIDQRMGTGGSGGGTTAAGTASLTTSWQRFAFTVTLPSMTGKTIGTGSFLMPQLQHPMNTTYTIDMWGVQLEAGSVATPFKRNSPNLQAELAACQRYYVRFADSSVTSPYALVPGYGHSNASSSVEFNVILPVTMRVPPTSLEYSGLSLQSPGGTVVFGPWSLVGIDSNVASKNVSGIVINKSGAFVSNVGYRMLRGNNSADYIGFSAEL